MRERVMWVFRPRAPRVDREAWIAELEAAVTAVGADVAPRLKRTGTVMPPPRWSVIPFLSRPVALVSVDTPDRAALRAAAVGAGLDALPSATWAELAVTTSVPVPLPVAPRAGEVTPGVELLTLFRRKKGLDDETFIQRWHGRHTPLSLEIHPLWGYIRNVVGEKWPASAPPLDGIVEEHFQRRRDLLDPTVFFDGPVRMVPNMLRVYLDIRRFIDLATIETYWVQERWLRLP